MSEFGVMTLLTKGFCMLKQISMAILCVMPLFLTSCIPNYFTYSKPGIYAECSLSGVQGFVAIDTLSESCVFTYFKIDYNGTAGQNPVLASVNVLLGGKSINLATVKFEDIKGVIPDGPWDKTVVENDFDKDNPFYVVIFVLYGAKKERQCSISFHFDKDKNMEHFYCIGGIPRNTKYVSFENNANKVVFEPPFKLAELKALFGADAHISKTYNLK